VLFDGFYQKLERKMKTNFEVYLVARRHEPKPAMAGEGPPSPFGLRRGNAEKFFSFCSPTFAKASAWQS
jgi:hypothetical protein